MSMLSLLAAPIGVALLLVGIHTYFGLHILRRGVIFVDLALAQIAAFGGLVAFLVGLPPDNPGSEVFSLVFALGGAALLAALRPPTSKPGHGPGVPQEALIGLTYAFASALALLVMAEAPEGAEHLRESLTGTLLWTEAIDILKAAGVYAGVAIVHVIFWKKIFAVSEDAAKAEASGINVARIDFIFYATFAVTVTHSVRVAGVLLVFVFLVAPATLAMTWSRNASFRRQLVIGWIVGLVVCLGGMGLSVAGDLTAGPTVIAVYALVLALSGLVRWVLHEPNRVRARRLGGFALVTGVAFVVLWGTKSLFAGAGAHAHDEAEAQALPEPSAAATPTAATSAAATSGAATSGASAASVVPPASAAPAASPTPQDPLAGALAALEKALADADTPEEKQAACVAAKAPPAVVTAALGRASDGFDRLGLARCLAAADAAAGHAALEALASDASAPELVRDAARGDLGAAATR
ncbi:MAG: metal ABC transporter permease [Myxococcota bacterium]